MGHLKTVPAFLALLSLSVFAQGADRQQVRAIWLLEGPTFPMDDAVIVYFIAQVVNPLTNMPWGNQEQSGGFNYLCDVKLGIDCSTQFPVSGSPPSSDTGAAAGPSPDTGAGANSPEGGTPEDGGDAGTPDDGTGDVAGDTSEDYTGDYSFDYGDIAPPPPSPARRLLQSDGKVYLYLDTTEPSPGAWQDGKEAEIIGNLRALMKNGKFQETFDAAAPITADLTLRFVNAVDVPPTPTPDTPSPATPTPDTPSPATPTPDPPAPDTPAPAGVPPPSTPVPPAPTPSSPSGTDVSTGGGGGSNAVIIGSVIGGVVGAAILAALVGTCMMRNSRRARDKVNADLMVHRWRREREQAAAAAAKGASGRSPFERSESIRQARAMTSKSLNQEGYRSYKGFNSDRQRSDLGLGKSGREPGGFEAAAHAPSASISPGKASDLDVMDIEMDNPVLDSSHARSAAPEYPPQEKKKKFLGVFGSKK